MNDVGVGRLVADGSPVSALLCTIKVDDSRVLCHMCFSVECGATLTSDGCRMTDVR